MLLSEIANELGAEVIGGELLAHCPAHEDENASLVLSVSDKRKLMFHCRAGCQQGSVAKALGQRSVDFKDVENDLPAIPTAVGGELPVSVAHKAVMAARVRDWQNADASPEAYDYARSRFGIDRQAFMELGLGYLSGETDYPEDIFSHELTKVPRLMVPFKDASGKLHGFQARDISEAQNAKAKWCGPSNPPDGGKWGRTAWFDGGTGMPFLVVAEGPGDALTAAAAAGFDSVGIRGASHAAAVVAELVDNHQGRTIVLAGDNDAAGERMNGALAQALLEAGVNVSVLQLPEGIGDISEWYVHDGQTFADNFQRAVTGAEAAAPAVAAEVREERQRLNSHLDVAREVLRRFPGVAWVSGLGFLIYAGGVWTADRRHAVRRKVHEISDELLEEAQALQREGKAGHEETMKAALKLRNTHFTDAVVRELESMTEADLEEFDADPMLLAVNNGVINLATGELMPHDRRHKLTKLIEMNYNPEAECPRWMQFVDEIMQGDESMTGYLQRLVGYGITGSTAEQCFAVLYGTGANGKSVFTDTLTHVFESITQTTPFSTFEEQRGGGIPNDVAALRGSRLVMASEGERGKPMAEAVLKRVTGQDLITARFMRQEFFSFSPTFLILLATNYKPAFRGQDEGLWRRVKLIPFKAYFAPEQRDHELADKLKAEAEGILAWSVRGAVEWHANGLQDPDPVTAATATYRETADALAGFFPAGPITRGADSDYVTGTDLYKAYEQWAEDEDLPLKERWTRRTLYGAMEERGVERINDPDRGGIILLGIKKAAPDKEPEKSGRFKR